MPTTERREKILRTAAEPFASKGHRNHHGARHPRAFRCRGTFRADVSAETFYRTVRDSLWASMHWPSRGDHSTLDFAATIGDLFLTGFRID